MTTCPICGLVLESPFPLCLDCAEQYAEEVKERNKQETMKKTSELPPRSLDTMSDAIALSSPSGRISKRARRLAEKRLSEKLFGPGGLTREKMTGAAPRQETPLEHAARLRQYATMAGKAQAKKLIAQAEQLEKTPYESNLNRAACQLI